MLSIYPACFFKEENGYSVVFPDLNLATCGHTLEEALTMAVDCLAGYLNWCWEDGEEVPAPSPITAVSPDKVAAELGEECGEAFVNMVAVDVKAYAKEHFNKSVKKTLTIPEWLKKASSQTGICYLIGAGDFGDGTPAPRPEDLVIAGDGGFRHCQERGIRVDLTVGDFDSLGYRPDHPHVLQLPAEKDDTDMRAALNLGWERGYRNFCIYGGTGGRISHTMANIQLLTELAARGGRGVLVGENSWYRVLRNGRWDFVGNEDGYLSVFSLSDRAEGVREQGLKYEVQDVTLTNEYPVGVSNEFTGRTGFVSVHEGTLLLIWERK